VNIYEEDELSRAIGNACMEFDENPTIAQIVDRLRMPYTLTRDKVANKHIVSINSYVFRVYKDSEFGWGWTHLTQNP
jgi:hypothetical protein